VWGIQKGHSHPPNKEYGFIRYAASTLINHLKTCSRQSEENRAQARHEAPSPRRPQRPVPIAPAISLPWPLSIPGSSQNSPPFPSMLPPSLPLTRTCSPAVSISALSASFPPTFGDLMIPSNDSPQLSPGQLFSGLSTPRSQVPSILIDDPGPGVWLPDVQRKFEERIARLTASAGLPLSWVDNPEWIDFINDFLPSARSPSRKVLTNRLIPTIAQGYRDHTKTMARGKNVTLQADGWTGVNFHHLLALMISFNNQV